MFFRIVFCLMLASLPVFAEIQILNPIAAPIQSLFQTFKKQPWLSLFAVKALEKNDPTEALEKKTSKDEPKTVGQKLKKIKKQIEELKQQGQLKNKEQIEELEQEQDELGEFDQNALLESPAEIKEASKLIAESSESNQIDFEKKASQTVPGQKQTTGSPSSSPKKTKPTSVQPEESESTVSCQLNFEDDDEYTFSKKTISSTGGSQATAAAAASQATVKACEIIDAASHTEANHTHLQQSTNPSETPLKQVRPAEKCYAFQTPTSSSGQTIGDIEPRAIYLWDEETNKPNPEKKGVILPGQIYVYTKTPLPRKIPIITFDHCPSEKEVTGLSAYFKDLFTAHGLKGYYIGLVSSGPKGNRVLIIRNVEHLECANKNEDSRLHSWMLESGVTCHSLLVTGIDPFSLGLSDFLNEDEDENEGNPKDHVNKVLRCVEGRLITALGAHKGANLNAVRGCQDYPEEKKPNSTRRTR